VCTPVAGDWPERTGLMAKSALPPRRRSRAHAQVWSALRSAGPAVPPAGSCSVKASSRSQGWVRRQAWPARGGCQGRATASPRRRAGGAAGKRPSRQQGHQRPPERALQDQAVVDVANATEQEKRQSPPAPISAAIVATAIVAPLAPAPRHQHRRASGTSTRRGAGGG